MRYPKREHSAITSNGGSYPIESDLSAIRWASRMQAIYRGEIGIIVPKIGAFRSNESRELSKWARANAIEVTSLRSRTLLTRASILIAAWPADREALDRIDLVAGEDPLCVIPWNNSPVEAWVERHNPELLNGEWRLEDPLPE